MKLGFKRFHKTKMSGDANIHTLSLLERFDGIIVCCAAQNYSTKPDPLHPNCYAPPSSFISGPFSDLVGLPSKYLVWSFSFTAFCQTIQVISAEYPSSYVDVATGMKPSIYT